MMDETANTIQQLWRLSLIADQWTGRIINEAGDQIIDFSSMRHRHGKEVIYEIARGVCEQHNDLIAESSDRRLLYAFEHQYPLGTAKTAKAVQMIRWKECQHCAGRGYLNPNGQLLTTQEPVERCRHCNRFLTDQEAALAMANAMKDRPIYLVDGPNHRGLWIRLTWNEVSDTVLKILSEDDATTLTVHITRIQ